MQFEYDVDVKLKDGTTDRRTGTVSEGHLREIMFGTNHDSCIGPCECAIEMDGHCFHGYPSHSLAAGII